LLGESGWIHKLLLFFLGIRGEYNKLINFVI
jgi:hypothetical protein